MTSRRGFLSSILAAAAAPAIVSASSIMRIVPVADTLRYKMSGRYDINFDEWVQDADSTLALRPTKIVVPTALLAEARRIIDAEFDKAYTQYRRRA